MTIGFGKMEFVDNLTGIVQIEQAGQKLNWRKFNKEWFKELAEFYFKGSTEMERSSSEVLKIERRLIFLSFYEGIYVLYAFFMTRNLYLVQLDSV